MAIVFSLLQQFSVGTSNLTSSGQQLTLAAGNLPIGSFGIVFTAYDNAGTQGADPVSSVTDSGGNVWTSRAFSLYDPGAASAGIVIKIFTSTISVEPTNLTLSFGVACVYTGYLSRATSDVNGTLSYISGAAGTGANDTVPTVTSTSISINDMIIGFGGKKDINNWVADADTLNGSWSAATSWLTGSGTAGLSGIIQTKTVTVAGTQTYNPTLAATAIRNVAWIQLREAAGAIARRLGLLGVG